jgi:hypothetical protein
MADKVQKSMWTPKGRVSFPSLFKPNDRFTKDSGQEPKYEVTMLFNKKADLSGLKNLVEAAIVEKWGKKRPKTLALPFRDGSEKSELEGYDDTIFIRCASLRQPAIRDENKQEVLNPNEIYPGCYGRVYLNAFGWEKFGKTGVSFGLLAFQKLSDGEPLGGMSVKEEIFEEEHDDSSNDESNYSDDDTDI